MSFSLSGEGQRLVCFSSCFFLAFYIVLGYSWLTSNVVIVSGEWQRASMLYSFLPGNQCCQTWFFRRSPKIQFVCVYTQLCVCETCQFKMLPGVFKKQTKQNLHFTSVPNLENLFRVKFQKRRQWKRVKSVEC